MQKNLRRQCVSFDQCLLFSIFQRTNLNISQKHAKASQFICNEGIKVLKNIAVDYLKARNKPPSQTYTFQVNANFQENNSMITKKELVGQPSQLSYTETKKYPSFCIASQYKKRENSFMPQKSKKKRMSQADELRQSLRKLDLQDKDLQNQQKEQESQQNIDLTNVQNIKNKSLIQMIQESNRKITEKNGVNDHYSCQLNDSTEQQYPLTDYSSNESSNQNEYDQQVREESSFSKNQPIIRNSFFYQPSKIMFSPKKSKSKAKRIYIRNKKIPRWAEDVQKVKQEVIKQKLNPEKFDTNRIYGVCYVQRLDTNVIFKSQSNYYRGSSAKWNRYPYNQFIE